MESSSLEEQAVKRKEKLKALKRKKDTEAQPNGEDNKESVELPKYFFMLIIGICFFIINLMLQTKVSQLQTRRRIIKRTFAPGNKVSKFE